MSRTYGWRSNFPEFRDAVPRVVRGSLVDFIGDASPQQVRAWDASIPQLQAEVDEIVAAEPSASNYTAVLEYLLPLDLRRPDVVLLVRGAVVVLELKGKLRPSQADIDQASAYARDLRCYHSACADRPVHAVVVPTRASGSLGRVGEVLIAGPDALDEVVRGLEGAGTVIDAETFLAEEAYRPLPTLVQAARELFNSGRVRRLHRKHAFSTEPAVSEISAIIHEAAATRTRRLVLVTGVPGAGKTLVGLQTVHSHFLDDLAVPRAGGKPTAPAVFLSGNGPLVQVLQYELASAGGGGQAFVRDVKSYVKRYSGKRSLIPPEHVLVFDEAQRAWDAERVGDKHEGAARSEPEHFIEFAERIPDWCVVLGLIGSGQEIHQGEEGGLVQWRHAVERSSEPDRWTVHGPANALSCFEGAALRTVTTRDLNLDTAIRFHLATDLHAFVAELLERDGKNAAALAARLESADYHLRLTRDLDVAKGYLRERYEESPLARFGIVASSRDKDLANLGVPNDFPSTSRMKLGPWYSDGQESPRSCRHLDAAVTEFGAQGLELDCALLAWGTDFVRAGDRWSIENSRKYRGAVRDPMQLRINAYRVLLTRGRDGTVVYVPKLTSLDQTYEFLLKCGFKDLQQS
jgi:hypothetical protein